jgi:hypothetical protein
MIYENVSLKNSFFRINVKADYLATFKLEDNAYIFQAAQGYKQKYLVLAQAATSFHR